jgi:hypothetical protein
MTQCGSKKIRLAGLKEAPERFREGAAKLAVAQSASTVGVSDGQKGRN